MKLPFMDIHFTRIPILLLHKKYISYTRYYYMHYLQFWRKIEEHIVFHFIVSFNVSFIVQNSSNCTIYTNLYNLYIQHFVEINRKTSLTLVIY